MIKSILTCQDELIEVRNPSDLKQPEFSQPLCTALQLALLSVLRDWGVTPHSVVGHSSGEMAAACAAGYLTMENAIKAAYYRGLAAKQMSEESEGAKGVGMLAVGLGADAVLPYLDSHRGLVQIACFNSPDSVTLSGKVDSLEKIMAALVSQSHFARMLQVNLAYHSPFMEDISNLYESLLLQDFVGNEKQGCVRMFSSVFGAEMRTTADAAYWKSNMTSAVRFEQATKAMLTDADAPDFLIEIGPSGTLSGPVGQIKDTLPGGGAHIQYVAAWGRGSAALKSLYEVAGKLLICGSEVSLARVNRTDKYRPRTIIDLPNYAWNHSQQYWYESDASKDWRYRLFPHHDLLGSKILGTSWHSPSFKKNLKLTELAWLKDHKLGSDIVFPAAGFFAMAMEAIRQTTEALRTLESKLLPTKYHYKLRDVTCSQALVLRDSDMAAKVMLALNPSVGPKDSWYEFKISSQVGDAWHENCRGLVKVEETTPEASTTCEGTIQPLVHPVRGSLWYKAMHDVGYNFGPPFQKQLEVESIVGKRESRSLVDLTPPASDYPQSWYPMHPTAIDGSFQSCLVSLWAGDRPRMDSVLITDVIDELIIYPVKKTTGKGIATTSSHYIGRGATQSTKNYKSNLVVRDSETGDLLLEMTGQRYSQLDARENPYSSHTYSRVLWKPDLTLLTPEVMRTLSEKEDVLGELIDLLAHKFPQLNVLEVSTIPGEATSAWLDGSKTDPTIRAASRLFQFSSSEASVAVTMEASYGSKSNRTFAALDITSELGRFRAPEELFDLVVVRTPTQSTETQQNVIRNARSCVSDKGYVLLEEQTLTESDVSAISSSSGFAKCFSLCTNEGAVHVFVADSKNLAVNQKVELVHFSDPTDEINEVVSELGKRGWQIAEACQRLANGEGAPREPRTILVLSDLSAPVLPSMTEDQWKLLKRTLVSDEQILWVTTGSQLQVTSPDRAMIHGLARTVRNEDPSIRIITLDVESATGPSTIAAINSVLGYYGSSAAKEQSRGLENEFVERQGVIHVSRVHPDDAINTAEKAVIHGAELVEGELHDFPTTVRLQCERVGTIDSLQYAEVSAKELRVPDGSVEVEIFAAGLNFKDVAITMGIIPGDQSLIGTDGAGTIRRAGKNADMFKPGDRVLVFEKGSLANRVIAPIECTHIIPEWMSFEDASTLPGVYPTAIYSMFDLANTKRGNKVLIHSASGGLGIAAIQLCQYIGAEIFATVGTEEKAEFLVDKLKIPRENIFNSRSIAFAGELKKATGGYGVDVILNTLTGELLDESWRCIADGGTMIELGKRDILDRNYLSM